MEVGISSDRDDQIGDKNQNPKTPSAFQSANFIAHWIHKRKDSQQHTVVASGQVKRKNASFYLVCHSKTLVLSSLFSTKTPSTHIYLNNFVDKSPVE